MYKLYVVHILTIVNYIVSVRADCGLLKFSKDDAPGYNIKGCTEYPDANTYTGSTATFKCERGWKLEGPDTETCMSTGKWDIEGTTPNCEEHDCINPELSFEEKVENGRIIGVRVQGWYSFGSAYTVMCNDGYRVKGEPLRTCLDDGTWSGDVPQCEPIPGYTVPITPAPCRCNYTKTPIRSSPLADDPFLSVFDDYMPMLLYALLGFSGVSLIFWLLGCICSVRYVKHTRGKATNGTEFASCDSLIYGGVVSIFQFVLPLALIPGSCCKMKRLRKFLEVGERSEESVPLNISENTFQNKYQRQKSKQLEENEKRIQELEDKLKRKKAKIEELYESAKSKKGDRCSRVECVENATLLKRADQDVETLRDEKKTIGDEYKTAKQKLEQCQTDKAVLETKLAHAQSNNKQLSTHFEDLKQQSDKLAQKTLDYLPDDETREQVIDILSSVSSIKTVDGESDLQNIISGDSGIHLRHKGGASKLTDNGTEATAAVENNYKGTQESASDSPEGRDFKSQLIVSQN